MNHPFVQRSPQTTPVHLPAPRSKSVHPANDSPVSSWPSGILQTKLEIGAPNDPLEHEADAMADRVMRMPLSGATFTGVSAGGAHLQRKCAACEQEAKIQPKSQSARAGAGHASLQLSSQIQSTRGQGHTMDQQTRNHMEQGFGRDFSGVRVHTGEYAHQMNQQLGARAFTVGNDVYFRQGEYQPGADSGRRLMAHELAHTVQQAGGIRRQVPPATPTPMTRAQFEQTMRTTYGVTTIRNGTEADQRQSMGIASNPAAVLPGWQAWDPGASNTVYQDIVDSFAAVNGTFSGVPIVSEITFYHTYYGLQNGAYVARSGVGAQFGSTDLSVYESTTTANKGLPIGRSVASGRYADMPVASLGYGGDPNAAPVGLPSRRQSAMRIIIHELGHGIAVAALQPGYGGVGTTAVDPNMITDYRRAVGWANFSDLYDIGVAAVSTAIQAGTTPPAAQHITASNWNDPVWVEQPISDYMVSGGPGEDFAEAVMVFVENPGLLLARSPHRHAFLDTRRATWQPRLRQPTPAAPATPATPGIAPTLMPLRPLYLLPPSMLRSPAPNPLMPNVPLLGPDPGQIDWAPLRREVESRGVPFDDAMGASVQLAWSQSYNFYNRVLGMGPAASAAWTNRSMPRLIGSSLTRDFPTIVESSDRSMGTSSIVLPVSDIVRFLMAP